MINEDNYQREKHAEVSKKTGMTATADFRNSRCVGSAPLRTGHWNNRQWERLPKRADKGDQTKHSKEIWVITNGKRKAEKFASLPNHGERWEELLKRQGG